MWSHDREEVTDRMFSDMSKRGYGCSTYAVMESRAFSDLAKVKAASLKTELLAWIQATFVGARALSLSVTIQVDCT